MKLSNNIEHPMGGVSSATIQRLRFPLAVMVVFIHSFGPALSADLMVNGILTHLSVYDICRIIFSKVIPSCSVPTFFLLSGWLFFRDLKDWDYGIWILKIKKRVKTLLVPYLIWITLSICIFLVTMLLGTIINGRPWDNIVLWLNENCSLKLYWDINANSTGLTSLFGIPIEASSPFLYPFWFIRDLMVAVLITPIYMWLHKRTNGWFIVLLMICYFTSTPTCWRGMGFSYWFYIGAWLSLNKYDLVEFSRKHMLLALLTISMLFIPMILLDGESTQYGLWLSPVFISALVIGLLSICSYVVQKYPNSCIDDWGKSSFFIYAAHTLVMPHIKKIFSIDSDSLPVQLLQYFLVPMVTILICIIAYKLIIIFFPRVSKYLGCR